MELPSRIFSGAVVQDIVIADNVELKFLGDANVFGDAQVNGLFIRDSALEVVPDNLFTNAIGLERLNLVAPLKSLSSKPFSFLGESLKTM